MEYSSLKRDAGGIPGTPAPDERRLNEAADTERVPEIARMLEQQKKLIEVLWTVIGKTDSMLSPILRTAPPKGTAEERARIEPMTHIGGILDEHNRSLDGMIGALVVLQKRIEI